MNIVASISDKGDGIVNEDVFGSYNNRFWVIDGVTAKTDKRFFADKSDAAYIANLFSEELKSYCSKNLISNNRELMKNAMKALRGIVFKKEFTDKEKKFQPSFTIAIVSIGNDITQIDILSDCYVILKCHDGISEFTDTRINVISHKTNTIREYICSNQISEDEAVKLLRNQKTKNRELMNTADGYWVGTLDGMAFQHTYSTQIRTNKIDKILICSDGYYKLFENDLCTREDILNETVSLQDSILMLREYEQKHYEPGMKKSDDATSVLIY